MLCRKPRHQKHCVECPSQERLYALKSYPCLFTLSHPPVYRFDCRAMVARLHVISPASLSAIKQTKFLHALRLKALQGFDVDMPRTIHCQRPEPSSLEGIRAKTCGLSSSSSEYLLTMEKPEKNLRAPLVNASFKQLKRSFKSKKIGQKHRESLKKQHKANKSQQHLPGLQHLVLLGYFLNTRNTGQLKPQVCVQPRCHTAAQVQPSEVSHHPYT